VEVWEREEERLEDDRKGKEEGMGNYGGVTD